MHHLPLPFPGGSRRLTTVPVHTSRARSGSTQGYSNSSGILTPTRSLSEDRPQRHSRGPVQRYHPPPQVFLDVFLQPYHTSPFYSPQSQHFRFSLMSYLRISHTSVYHTSSLTAFNPTTSDFFAVFLQPCHTSPFLPLLVHFFGQRNLRCNGRPHPRVQTGHDTYFLLQF